jgi:hypothetical protein
MALVGSLRFAQHRSVPISIGSCRHAVLPRQRRVTNMRYRYEELLAHAVADQARVHAHLKNQAQWDGEGGLAALPALVGSAHGGNGTCRGAARLSGESHA